jgi:hypothetical protein
VKIPFRVIRGFTATAAISCRERQFEPDDEISCDAGQFDEIIKIEADDILYLVKRSTFEDCCISNNAGYDPFPFVVIWL